jgi:hypothetical protein
LTLQHPTNEGKQIEKTKVSTTPKAFFKPQNVTRVIIFQSEGNLKVKMYEDLSLISMLEEC